MKKKNRKLKIKKISFILLIIFILLGLYLNFNHLLLTFFSSQEGSNTMSNLTNSGDYPIIKQDNNPSYSGAGQVKVSNRDGYFTTFTTLKKHEKIYKEYKQNSTASWSLHDYWGGTMEENGCGITAISVILSGYHLKTTPESLRKKYAPVLDPEQISTELSKTFQIKNSDFYYDSVHLSNQSLLSHLETNRPILICLWNKPSENRWTSSSHYMVLLACQDHMVYVSNPNRIGK